MARKNSKVRRSNDKGRLARRQRGELPRPPTKAQPRVRIEDMVLPDGQCRAFTPRRPKARFATKAKAEKALAQAKKNRARQGTGHVEKRVYECPTVPCPECERGVAKERHTCPTTGCGGWHLTSRETFDDSIREFRHEQFLQKTKNKALGAKRESGS